eukprot:TRINITY_DN1083_c0_g1_i6.p1 TRINITY_DN1083_c0_g1~~TRINITY_DN1083_c0_g1_i6.p1  ORF type:complete len:150 (-),score=20.71 TRINITY_DN1083_c0_g1_i6:200-649(-)
MGFHDYIHQFQYWASLNDVPYLSDWKIDTVFEGQTGKYLPHIPNFLVDWPNIYPDENPGYFFIGPEGTVSKAHTDAHNSHGWLLQIQGQKLCKLWPSSLIPYKDYEPMLLHLKPGQGLFIPPFWVHEITALSVSVSVQWLVPYIIDITE